MSAAALFRPVRGGGGGDDARELDALLGSANVSDCVRLRGLLPLLLGPLESCGVGSDVSGVRSLV